MSKYKQIRQYLDSFINYEKQADFAYCRVLKLERVRELLRRCGIEYEKLKVIHIAGTKGKGSTAHFCADLLADTGYKVGLYTSPHFFDFRERIIIKYCRGEPMCSPESMCQPDTKYVGEGFKPSRMINQMISKKDVVRIVEEIKPCLEKLRFSQKLGRLSFFEVYTAIAFKYFLEKKVDFAVIETGMGGRLDATNVVRPLVSIITRIGYDHTDSLGKTLDHIGYEKAGIIKKGIPVVSSFQRPAVFEVINKKCRKMSADLFVFGRQFGVQAVNLRRNYTVFDFKFNHKTFKNVKISLKGMAQVENAALALAAVKILESRGVTGKIKSFCGIRDTFVAGRFEKVSINPAVIMDIAHNPISFSVLADNLKRYFPLREIILIFAAAHDKDVRKMLKQIKYSSLILTRFNNLRSFSPQEIKTRCKLKDPFVAKDVKEAFNFAKQLYNKDSVIVISGSLFLVAEAKRLW